MTLVKICGVRDVETALVAAEAGADFIGLMFAPSKRQITPEAAHAISTALRERRTGARPRLQGPVKGEVSGRTWFAAWSEAIQDALTHTRPLIVGVFAGQEPEIVQRIANAAALDIVQLSGGESFDTASQLDVPAVIAVHVDNEVDPLDRIEPGAAAGVLLDTKVDGAHGGTGVAFDWAIAAQTGERVPLFLAGGLTPENVATAIAQARPWAVDVSSGVETDGQKDHDKIRSFIAAAKRGSE